MRYFYVILLLLAMGCKEKKYHSESKSVLQLNDSTALSEILEFQVKMNQEFKDPESSPLPDRYRKDFEGLTFFQPDTTFRVVAKFVRTPEAVPFMMPTTTDRKSKEVTFGVAYFSLKGKKYELEVYQNQELMLEEKYKDYLFLPFLDETNGAETYTGGRYIDLSIPEGDSMIIDFNQAYNPYCAYNKKYSCPIVPTINSLPLKVKAGVKAFEPTGK
ncbi:DUF1684 domain-containing protein [Flavobacteriaceae bacterium KMM 6897]|nr:DUF1684 domain-containing protein [Flavobacteriaceae bacterium KMM 6897]MEB8344701.1 DUF1684 domain-containing protein [Flavobacteriaceae bacterium KMM 6898]